jgi:ABC-type multidrug transport system fused ATPase/permease subunit
MRASAAAVEAVIGDLKGQPPPLASAPRPLPFREAIRFDDVTYQYPGATRPALRGADLAIPAGTAVGFIGATGAGKSTAVDLFLGLLVPTQGRILIDGVPLAADNRREWQANLGYVPQAIFLADATVAENIAFGVPAADIDRAAVERAARMANIHDFVVTALPNGYDTAVGERGIRLSGGQRQRIGIARALYRDPPVLVFDEATSALDSTTEAAVMEAVGALHGRKTMIIVAHRLSTTRGCDRIFTFVDGTVSENLEPQLLWSAAKV